ncbi:MAG: AAA family ATPase, partial [Thermoplasmatales archaeon]
TPGAGKSTLMEEMKKRGYEVHEFDELVASCIKSYEDGEGIVDEKCIRKIRKEGIYFGHLSHYAKCDLVIVLRAHLKDIAKRLSDRGYNRKKVMENVECEAIDLIGEESLSIHPGKTYEVMNDDVERTADVIERIIKGEISPREKIDLVEEILDWY